MPLLGGAGEDGKGVRTQPGEDRKPTERQDQTGSGQEQEHHRQQPVRDPVVQFEAQDLPAALLDLDRAMQDVEKQQQNHHPGEQVACITYEAFAPVIAELLAPLVDEYIRVLPLYLGGGRGRLTAPHLLP